MSCTWPAVHRPSQPFLSRPKHGGIIRKKCDKERAGTATSRYFLRTLHFRLYHLKTVKMAAAMSAASMAALNTQFAGKKVNKVAAKKVSARVATRAVKPVRAAVAAPADVSADTVQDCVNTIRFLAIDAINKSNSGHPGLPMGCAPMGYVLYREAMTHNPKDYKWFNRDRFVLSAGHGCMLQYSLMHLTGYPSVSVSNKRHPGSSESRHARGDARIVAAREHPQRRSCPPPR